MTKKTKKGKGINARRPPTTSKSTLRFEDASYPSGQKLEDGTTLANRQSHAGMIQATGTQLKVITEAINSRNPSSQTMQPNNTEHLKELCTPKTADREATIEHELSTQKRPISSNYQ